MPIRKPVEYGAVLKKISRNLVREHKNLNGKQFQKLLSQRDFQTRYAMALSKAMTKAGLHPQKFPEVRRQIHALGRKMGAANIGGTAKNRRTATDSWNQIMEIIKTKKSEKAANSFELAFEHEFDQIIKNWKT